MVSLEERALVACIDYSTTLQAIELETKSIGSWLCLCGNDHVDGGSHLSIALAPVDSELAPPFTGKVRSYPDDDEVAASISGCIPCQQAFAAIKRRKALRQKLGAIKRTIRAIGKV